MYPLLLNPALHTRVWGGRKLETVFGKTLPTDEPYGESWELHDSVTIANGTLAGRTLGDVLAEYGAALIGDVSDPREGFPLLLKFLDANDWLSVQVHPDDGIAAKLEGEPRGKTEAWIVLAADPDTRLALGVEPGLTSDQLEEAIRDNTLDAKMRYVPVQTGDAVYLDAGTIHAMGPGVLIYEVQQSSDQTYRMYDWGRMGLDGKPRPLHIDKSLVAAKLDLRPEVRHLPDGEGVAVAGPYFETVAYRLQGGTRTFDTGGNRFHALTVARGGVTVSAGGEPVSASLGQTVLIPADVGRYDVSGTGDILRASQP